MEQRISPPTRINLGLKELWDYRELFYFFTWRDIKVKYKQSLLGFSWAVLQPLILMVIMTVLFGNMLGMEQKTGSTPYPIFVYSGLMLWGIFSTGLTSAGNSMVSNSNLIKKIYFPRLIIPLSAILVSVFDFLMAFIVFIALLVFYNYSEGFAISWGILSLMFLPCLITSVTATLGIGSLMAALNVKYRDFRYIVPFVVQVLFFVTPVIYPISMFEGSVIQNLLALNPMLAPISLMKASVIGSVLDWNLILLSLLSNLVLLVTGILYFKKTEAYFADIV